MKQRTWGLRIHLQVKLWVLKKDKTTLRGEEKIYLWAFTTSSKSRSYDYSYTHLLSGEDNGEYVTIDEDSANWKQIFWYFPAVIGTIFARIMHFGATPTLYIARLF